MDAWMRSFLRHGWGDGCKVRSRRCPLTMPGFFSFPQHASGALSGADGRLDAIVFVLTVGVMTAKSEAGPVLLRRQGFSAFRSMLLVRFQVLMDAWMRSFLRHGWGDDRKVRSGRCPLTMPGFFSFPQHASGALSGAEGRLDAIVFAPRLG